MCYSYYSAVYAPRVCYACPPTVTGVCYLCHISMISAIPVSTRQIVVSCPRGAGSAKLGVRTCKIETVFDDLALQLRELGSVGANGGRTENFPQSFYQFLFKWTNDKASGNGNKNSTTFFHDSLSHICIGTI